MEVLNVILFLAGFFRTLLVIIVIYYLIRFITKYVIPLFISRPDHSNNFRNQKQSRKEGDVTIEGDKPGNGKISKDEGEYVDYEEID